MTTTKESALLNHLRVAFVNFIDHYNFNDTDINFDVCVALDISKRFYKDAERLAQNHDMKGINSKKTAGYITYWVAKLRPLSIVNAMIYHSRAELCLYINEAFAFYVATGCLISTNEIKNIRIHANFLESFLYLLKYRPTTGDNLAMHYHLMDNR